MRADSGSGSGSNTGCGGQFCVIYGFRHQDTGEVGLGLGPLHRPEILHTYYANRMLMMSGPESRSAAQLLPEGRVFNFLIIFRCKIATPVIAFKCQMLTSLTSYLPTPTLFYSTKWQSCYNSGNNCAQFMRQCKMLEWSSGFQELNNTKSQWKIQLKNMPKLCSQANDAGCVNKL